MVNSSRASINRLDSKFNLKGMYRRTRIRRRYVIKMMGLKDRTMLVGKEPIRGLALFEYYVNDFDDFDDLKKVFLFSLSSTILQIYC